MARSAAPRMLKRSISSTLAKTTETLSALAKMISQSDSRAGARSTFESLSPSGRSSGSRMTAATPTGPASGPRPTSSTPATHRWPLAKASRSKSKCGVVTTGRGGGAAFFFTVLHAARRRIAPFVGPQAIAAAAGAPRSGYGNAGGKRRAASGREADRLFWGAWKPPTLSWNASHPLSLRFPGSSPSSLGGSRATGAAHASSDYDIGLYFSERVGLDVQAPA